MTSVTEDNAYERITWFRIYFPERPDEAHPKTFVFANGRQCCPVMISITAVNKNGIEVDVPEDRIHLIHYESGERLVQAGDPSRAFFESKTHRGWTFDESILKKYDAMKKDALLALEWPEAMNMLRMQSARYPSFTLEGHSWDKEQFDSYLDYLRRHPLEGHSALSSTALGGVTVPTTFGRRVIAEAGREPPPGVRKQTFTRYVLCDLDDDATARIAAGVLRYYDNPELPYLAKTNGDTDPDTGAPGDQNEFDSSVTVHALKMRWMGIASYGEKLPGSTNLLNDHWVTGNEKIRYYEHKVGVKIGDTELLLRESRADTGSYGGYAYGVWKHSGEKWAEWSITYRAQPGDRTKSWDYDGISRLVYAQGNMQWWTARTIKQLVDTDGPDIVNSSPYYVTIGMVLGNEHWQFFDYANNFKQQENIQLYIRDAYGNDHRMTLSCRNLNYLSIHEPSAAASIENMDPPRDDLIVGGSLTLLDTMVYANGLQQAVVKFRIDAQEGGNPRPLTPSEEASIVLIDFDSPTQIIPTTDGGDTTYLGWTAQKGDRGYLPYPSARATPGVGDTYTRYITATRQATRPLQIGFAITGDDGVIYRSNGTRIVDGVVEDMTNFRFPDHFITPVPQPAYSKDNFVLDGLIEDEPLDFDRKLLLSVLGPRGETVPLHSATCSPHGIGLWKLNAHGIVNFAGFAGPGEAALQWHENVPDSHEMPRPETTDPVENRCVVMLCGRDDIVRPDKPIPREMSIDIIDAYGNPRTCRVRLVEGKWGYAELY